jgi:hypothetical protein
MSELSADHDAAARTASAMALSLRACKSLRPWSGACPRAISNMQAVVAIQMRIGIVRSFLVLIVSLGYPALTIKISKEMSRSIPRKGEPHVAFCLSGAYLGLGSMPQAVLLARPSVVGSSGARRKIVRDRQHPQGTSFGSRDVTTVRHEACAILQARAILPPFVWCLRRSAGLTPIKPTLTAVATAHSSERDHVFWSCPDYITSPTYLWGQFGRSYPPL